MSSTMKWGAVAICAAAGALLAWQGVEGWGWFLLVAVLLTGG